MELKTIFFFMQNNFRHAVLSGVIIALLGALLFYAFPPRQIVVGTFYVSRGIQEVDLTTEEFHYEGFYAQRAATEHTDVVAGILKSDDFAFRVVASLEHEGIALPLKKFSRAIVVKRVSSQLVRVSIPETLEISNPEKVWFVVAEELNSIVSQKLQVSDPNISVSLLGREPVITETYSNVFLNMLVGFVLGFSFYNGFVALREYLQA